MKYGKIMWAHQYLMGFLSPWEQREKTTSKQMHSRRTKSFQHSINTYNSIIFLWILLLRHYSVFYQSRSNNSCENWKSMKINVGCFFECAFFGANYVFLSDLYQRYILQNVSSKWEALALFHQDGRKELTPSYF